MRESNIISILSAYHKLPKNIFESYLNHFSIRIKKDELDDLTILYNHLKTLTKNIELFDKYFIGYSIPQIGKEFDLLRFDNETIVNVELKRESDLEKIETQLRRNKYYLSFLKKETHLFSYEASTKKLFGLDESNNLIELNIRQLIEKLASQNVVNLENINKLFNPSNYLVSPFNSTQEFIKNRYFLTVQQEDIKNQILKEFDKPKYSIISIRGKAGTGKTLLTYDIAKDIYKSKEIIIIHCGILNKGHITLRDDYAWKIVSAKSLVYQDYTKYDLVIVDEAQRIRKGQLNHLIEQIKLHGKNCIFSYDSVQTLRGGEIRANVSSEIEKNVTKHCFELTTKIRTNKEVARFIKCLFNTEEIIHKMDYSNVELKYFETYNVAKLYLNQLKSEGWKITNYTPSTVHTLPYEQHRIEEEDDNAHTVIGQEFDNVVAVIDEYFYYKNNKLSTRNYKDKPYYHPTKMLFQIVSRTRLKLCVIIVNNPILLERCLSILSKNTST
ncbi:DNA/RNA helicase domain-containing protein [Tenacibaculum sp. TC6]|uniref:DNA/RNA helicase domain-containing protein n=1 Tax=Tenacibaculum sp. TC6 TaxID=3423223 RepID=UPI003D36FE2E